MKYPLCLTIAGSDSGGEAGIQADLTTFKDFNCHGLSAITANTAQSPIHLLSINPVSSQCLKDQLSELSNYFEISHIKTGLLPNIQQMEIILELISEKALLITDPLISSTSGTTIMEQKTLLFFKEFFTKRVDYITPNIPEAKILLKDNFSVDRIEELASYARKGIYLKGGHSSNPGIDYFYNKSSTWKLTAPELTIQSSHGTGCRLSSALCAGFATGHSPIKSAELAKNYVFHSLKNCKETQQEQWLISSPGNIFNLENYVQTESLR